MILHFRAAPAAAAAVAAAVAAATAATAAAAATVATVYYRSGGDLLGYFFIKLNKSSSFYLLFFL